MPRPPAQGQTDINAIRKELLRRKGDWTRFSKTPPKVGYRWLISFAKGKIKDPGHTRLVKLAQHLGMEVSVSKNGIGGTDGVGNEALRGDGKKE